MVADVVLWLHGIHAGFGNGEWVEVMTELIVGEQFDPFVSMDQIQRALDSSIELYRVAHDDLGRRGALLHFLKVAEIQRRYLPLWRPQVQAPSEHHDSRHSIA
jgi:hypothetical protein